MTTGKVSVGRVAGSWQRFGGWTSGFFVAAVVGQVADNGINVSIERRLGLQSGRENLLSSKIADRFLIEHADGGTLDVMSPEANRFPDQQAEKQGMDDEPKRL